MKNYLTTTLCCLMLAGSLFFTACNGNHSHGEGNAPHGANAAFTSDYVCPMHCEGSGGTEAGKCPACGMDYVPQDEHLKDGHHH